MSAQRRWLTPEGFELLQAASAEGRGLDTGLAAEVARALRGWAASRGATHVAFLTQPLAGEVAEHRLELRLLTGRELVHSTAPVGRLAWDPASAPFIRVDADGAVLCLPALLASDTGEALDGRLPLLRSLDALSDASVRALRVLGVVQARRVSGTIAHACRFTLSDEQPLLPRGAADRERACILAAERQLARVGVLATIRPVDPRDEMPSGAATGRGEAGRSEATLGGTTGYGLGRAGWDDLLGGGSTDAAAGRGVGEAARRAARLAPGGPAAFVAAHRADTGALIADLQPAGGGAFEIVLPPAPAGVAADRLELAFATLGAVGRRYGLAVQECGGARADRWSLTTAGGANLLAPGATPAAQLRFLFFAAAVVRAFDAHPRLARAVLGDQALDLGADLEHILGTLARGGIFAGSDEELTTGGAPLLPTVGRREVAFGFTGAGFALGRLEPLSATILNTIVADAIAEQTRAVRAWVRAGEDLEPAVREVLADTARRHRLLRDESFRRPTAHAAHESAAIRHGAASGTSGHEASAAGLAAACDAPACEVGAARLAAASGTSAHEVGAAGLAAACDAPACEAGDGGHDAAARRAAAYAALSTREWPGAAGLDALLDVASVRLFAEHSVLSARELVARRDATVAARLEREARRAVQWAWAEVGPAAIRRRARISPPRGAAARRRAASLDRELRRIYATARALDAVVTAAAPDAAERAHDLGQDVPPLLADLADAARALTA